MGEVKRLNITLYVESYEDLETQCAELFKSTGCMAEKAVMPWHMDDWDIGPGVSMIQVNTALGPVRVDLVRSYLRGFERE
jgi:hypothetical protein